MATSPSYQAPAFPRLPAEFWEQMEIKNAVDHQDFGRVLKCFRELQSPPIKQTELAKELNLTQGQISRLENGRSKVTDINKLARWAATIGAPQEILWFSLPTCDQIEYLSPTHDKIVNEKNKEDGVDRRQFIKGSVAASAIGGLSTMQEESSISHAVTHDDVERLREWTQDFRRKDNRWGGGHSLSQALHYRNSELIPMLNESRITEKVRTELLTSAAQLFQLIGWMQYDINERNEGRRALRNAFQAADEAKDHALAAEMQAGLSHQASFLRMPDFAQDCAVNARHHAKMSGLPSLKSEAAVMEAHALALQGDLRGTVKALQEADDLFQQIRPAEVPEWQRYYDNAYLAAKFGHVLRDLGRPQDAERYARESLHMSDGYERGRTFNLSLLAGILADQGQLDEAMQHAELALSLTSSMKSARTQRYLSDVGQSVMRFRTEPRVKHYLRELGRRGIPAQRVN